MTEAILPADAAAPADTPPRHGRLAAKALGLPSVLFCIVTWAVPLTAMLAELVETIVIPGDVICSEGGVVWVAGDTSLYAEMREIASYAGGRVDLAVVPIGGWGPRLSQGHMDARDAARACALVHARYALPVHWGTLHLPGLSQVPRGWMQRPGPEFVEALEELAPKCRALVVELGGSAVVPAA